MTAPPISSVIGDEEMPRGVGPVGGVSSSILSSISPSIVGSTWIESRRRGFSGLASVSHSAGSGTDRTNVRSVLDYGEESVSVAFEEVGPDDRAERVDMKPGYTM